MPLYPLSAREGLAAKMRHDDIGVRHSGLTTFEQELTAFLAESNREVGILRMPRPVRTTLTTPGVCLSQKTM